MRFFWIYLLLLATVPLSHAAPLPLKPIPLSDSLIIEVSKGFHFVADKNGSIQLKDLTGKSPYISFMPVDSKAWNKDIDSYWLHFYVVNNTGFDREWVFDFENWAFIDFYFLRGAEFVSKKTGHLHPFSNRVYPIANKNYIKVPIKNREIVECMVRLNSQVLIGKFPENLSFRVAPSDLIEQEEALSSKIIFAFLGAFAIMFLYNSIIYFSTWLKAYGYYLLGLFFVAFHTAGNSGYIFPLFGWLDSFPEWFFNFNLISSNLWGIVYILFVQNLLKTKERYPKWNKILNILMYLYILALFSIIFYFNIGFAFTQILGLVNIILVLWLGIKSVIDRYPSAWFFLIGNTALLIGIFTIIFTLAGILPKNKFNLNYALPVGSTIEILFYSFALANMINVLRRENEEKQKRIIDQLHAYQQLQALTNNELEQKVKVRTSELELSLTQLKNTQNQLVQKEKMASLGELTAGIAHEIQNPLNFINNYSEVSRELLDELAEERQKGGQESDSELEKELMKDLDENLLKIHHHGQRADSIVKNMLRHSRRSSGSKSPTDLNALTNEYLRLAYHSVLNENNTFQAELKTDFDGRIGMIDLIPQDFGQVLLNIYNNAFYAIQEKVNKSDTEYQPEINVKTRLLDVKVEVRVRDNGTGMSEEVLKKLFQPFFTTKPAGSGTGLGLSLSYDIITHEFGGDITVLTEVGNYSEFLVTIPNEKNPIPITT